MDKNSERASFFPLRFGKGLLRHLVLGTSRMKDVQLESDRVTKLLG